MKRLFSILFIVFIAIQAIGQPSVDIGVFGGAGTYLGDMTKVDFQKSLNPAYGGFIRYNFNPRYGLRFNIQNGTIGAEGEFQSEPWTFSKNVLDISLNFEFNYLKYIVGDRSTRWSSFLFGGLGVQMYSYEFRGTEMQPFVDPTYYNIPHKAGSVTTPEIPFGMGVKFNLSQRWGIGLEGGFRKTFSDKLDDLDDPLSHITGENVQVKYTDQFHNNDWTAFLGVHLVYKMIYGIKQWDMETPRKKILDWGIWNNNRRQ
jgi:opacity protein-like surface antigen